MYKFVDDQGYYMYNIGTREMQKISIKNPEASKLLLRSQHTVNTVKVLATQKDVLNYNRERKIEMTNYMHFIFGGEVYNAKE